MYELKQSKFHQLLPTPPLTGIPQRIHGFAAWLPAAKSDVLPFVNRVQELDVYPLVHGLGIPEVSKILNGDKTVSTQCYSIFFYLRHGMKTASFPARSGDETSSPTLQLQPGTKGSGMTHGWLTLLVAEKTLFPSLNSGTNFCRRAFWTFQMAGGSLPSLIVTWMHK